MLVGVQADGSPVYAAPGAFLAPLAQPPAASGPADAWWPVAAFGLGAGLAMLAVAVREAPFPAFSASLDPMCSLKTSFGAWYLCENQK